MTGVFAQELAEEDRGLPLGCATEDPTPSAEEARTLRKPKLVTNR